MLLQLLYFAKCPPIKVDRRDGFVPEVIMSRVPNYPWGISILMIQ